MKSTLEKQEKPLSMKLSANLSLELKTCKEQSHHNSVRLKALIMNKELELNKLTEPKLQNQTKPSKKSPEIMMNSQRDTIMKSRISENC